MLGRRFEWGRCSARSRRGAQGLGHDVRNVARRPKVERRSSASSHSDSDERSGSAARVLQASGLTAGRAGDRGRMSGGAPPRSAKPIAKQDSGATVSGGRPFAKGGNRGVCRWSAQAGWLWDLNVATRARNGNAADEPIGEVAKAAVWAPKRWACSMSRRVREVAIALQRRSAADEARRNGAGR